MNRNPGSNRKPILSSLLLAFCAVAIVPLFLSGPCDLASRSAIAAAYNFRATTAVNAGDVVIWDSTLAYAIKTTNEAACVYIAGVSAETVSAGNDCTIRQDGGRVAVNVVGAVTKGQWLITSTATGKAQGIDAVQSGVFARAITDEGTPAAGQVYASVNLGFLGYGSGGGGGVTDHGALTGLGDDDHSQYHNDARGDTRYLYRENTSPFTPDADYEPATKKYVDDNAGGSPGGADTNVQYNSGGGFGGDSDWTWNDTLNHMFVKNGLAAIQSVLRLYPSGSTSIGWNLQASGSTADLYTLTFPITQGPNGAYLRTDGNGNLSFDTPAGSGDMTKSVYDTNANGDIDVAAGGTEKSTWTQYAIPYLSASTTFGEIPIGTANQHLAVNGTANGYEFVDAPSCTNTKFLPFEMRLGVPPSIGNNNDIIDFRQDRLAGTIRTYAKRTALSGTNTASSMYLGVQLPADFNSFYSGTNIYIYVYTNDYANNTITLTVYDDGGDPDDGVNAASINPTANTNWQEKSDQLTESYTAGDWIWIKIEVNLDSGDYYYLGEGYIKYDT